MTSESIPPTFTPAGSPTSWIATVAWIVWSSRTSRRSMCEIVPRIGSCWYSARIDGCTVDWPSMTTSRIAWSPEGPVIAVRSARSGTEMARA